MLLLEACKDVPSSYAQTFFPSKEGTKEQKTRKPEKQNRKTIQNESIKKLDQ
jgi:hypothetical protein